MTSPSFTRARLLAAALVLALLPRVAPAQEVERGPDASSNPAAHPWKLAYARRLAQEGMERKQARERWLQRTLREWREIQRAKKLATGQRARPVAGPDAPAAGGPAGTAAAPLGRHARAHGANVFTTPSNTIVNSRIGDGFRSGQCETSIVGFGDIIVAAWNDGQGFLSSSDTQGWATSSDGGVTWIDRGNFPHPALANFEWASDPVLAVNEKTGAFYFSALCSFSNGLGARFGVGVIKGRWNGLTVAWGTPVIAHDSPFVDSEIPDKNWIVADSVSSRVYLTYSQFQSGLSRIVFQRADSNAVTWSPPIQLSLDTPTENGWVQGSRPIVDGDGMLYVMYELIGQGFSDFYKVRRSDNQGLSFASAVVAESLYTNFGTGAPGFNRPLGIDFAGIAVDRSHGPNRGRLYLSWAESINWLDEVFTLGLLGNKSEVESNNTAATATPITLGQTVRGTVSSSSDVDLFSLPLTQGQHVVIAADSAESATASALSLRMIAGDGITRLTFTTFDDGVNPVTVGGDASPAGWMFTAPVAGTYFIRVETFNGTGAYRLRTGAVHRNLERGRDQRDVFVAYSDGGSTWSDPKPLSGDPPGADPPGFDSFVPEVAVAPDGGVYCSWFDYRDAAPAKDGGEAGVFLSRSGDGGSTWTTLGALADTLTDWTVALANIAPNQGDYMSLFTSGSYLWSLWSDGRRGDPDAFLARIPIIPNGAQVAFLSVRLADRRITMDWRTTPADTLTMRLYRSQDDGPFQFVDVLTFDAAGGLTFADTGLVADHVYAYRLGRFTNGVELFYGQVRVFLPSTFPLRMGRPRPDPVVAGTFVADFSLATDEPADILLFDITGREVFRRRVNLGKGPHTLTLPVDGDLHQGLFVLTVRQGGHNASSRLHLVR